MGDTVAVILALLVVAGMAAFVSYLIGSIVCAIAGLGLGPFVKIGLGLLGLVTSSLLFALLHVRPPAWTAWITAPLLVCGAVLLVRHLRRSPSRGPRRGDLASAGAIVEAPPDGGPPREHAGLVSTATPGGSRRTPRGKTIGVVVVGATAVAFVATSVGAFLTDDEAQRELFVSVGTGLILLLGILPTSPVPASQRTRLLELGWALFISIGLLFAACLYWRIPGNLLVSPWGYVFLLLALGMIVWGYSLPKVDIHPTRRERS